MKGKVKGMSTAKKGGGYTNPNGTYVPTYDEVRNGYYGFTVRGEPKSGSMEGGAGRAMHYSESPLTQPSYKKGGIVKKTGPALVHKGELVIPKSKLNKTASKMFFNSKYSK